jgi:dephospho-CoA kinase
VVDREKLAKKVLGDPQALKELEAIVHPLVRDDETIFLEEQRRKGAPLVVLDIPLLFEVGAEGRVDKVAVVSAPAGIQRERVMARPGMTEAKFEAILKKQVPDAEKRRRADYVIDSGRGLEPARLAVERIIEELANGATIGKQRPLST